MSSVLGYSEFGTGTHHNLPALALAPVHKNNVSTRQGFIGKIIHVPKERSCCTHEVLQRYLDSLLPTTFIEHTPELTP